MPFLSSSMHPLFSDIFIGLHHIQPSWLPSLPFGLFFVLFVHLFSCTVITVFGGVCWSLDPTCCSFYCLFIGFNGIAWKKKKKKKQFWVVDRLVQLYLLISNHKIIGVSVWHLSISTLGSLKLLKQSITWLDRRVNQFSTICTISWLIIILKTAQKCFN
jgi:hypothetical protein